MTLFFIMLFATVEAADLVGFAGAALMKLDDQARAALILEPGFSSRDTVSEISGRGVGMDVVRSNVEQIGGRLSLSNRPGRGLTVALEVPLTLAIINIVMVETIAGRFAVPRQSIEEIVSVGQEDTRVEQLAGATIARVRGALLPMVDLGRMFGVPATEPSPLIAVIALRDGRFALPLTRVVDMQELVVKPAAPAAATAAMRAGVSTEPATITGFGAAAVVTAATRPGMSGSAAR